MTTINPNASPDFTPTTVYTNGDDPDYVDPSQPDRDAFEAMTAELAPAPVADVVSGDPAKTAPKAKTSK